MGARLLYPGPLEPFKKSPLSFQETPGRGASACHGEKDTWSGTENLRLGEGTDKIRMVQGGQQWRDAWN